MDWPMIIQGGMGIGVSNWRLARAVAMEGELGVVSGTALSSVLVRRLQKGDPDESVRRALSHFPFPAISEKILRRYFVAGGIPPRRPFKRSPMYSIKANRDLDDLTVAANFVEVHLAKEGHDGKVGINFLEKIQLPHLPSLYGAMLAGVDVVLMGAGIPREIPGALDRLSKHEPASLNIDVESSSPDERHMVHFDPGRFYADGSEKPELKRPAFFAIISSAILAKSLLGKSSGSIEGFVAEGPKAGGHNAPPRGKLQLNDRGEPVYTERDAIDTEQLAKLGRPFWLAGSYGRSDGLNAAIASGARGIQVGTAFALCEESGVAPEVKTAALRKIQDQSIDDEPLVYTDPISSPTGMPFKAFRLENSISEEPVYKERPRKCDLGYLRRAYVGPNGQVGYRCPGEPEDTYVAKGGLREETQGRKCLCNALLATIGLGQHQESGYAERPLLTTGDHLATVRELIANGKMSYTASDVIRLLRS